MRFFILEVSILSIYLFELGMLVLLVSYGGSYGKR